MINFIDQFQYFTSKLINWYEANKRDLPWRNTNDPYKIWLSEIILQQTKVSQGLNYYLKFVKNYPNVESLSEAEEDSILKDWQGLGYYSRARNLHASAKYIHKELDGNFPDTYEKIKKLKGVGDYTASAISSFVFNEKNAVVDGNVYRVLSRFFGISTPIDSSLGIKEFKNLAQTIIPIDKPGIFNQAIMEFGAMHCTPKNPNCHNCPFSDKCFALEHHQIESLPVKKSKTKVKPIYFYYFIIKSEKDVLMKKRTKKGIWQNLYDFPLIESNTEIREVKNIEEQFKKNFNTEGEIKFESISEPRKHLLSHRKILASFIHIDSSSKFDQTQQNLLNISLKELKNYPIPKLIENYLREETNLLHLY